MTAAQLQQAQDLAKFIEQLKKAKSEIVQESGKIMGHKYPGQPHHTEWWEMAEEMRFKIEEFFNEQVKIYEDRFDAL